MQGQQVLSVTRNRVSWVSYGRGCSKFSLFFFNLFLLFMFQVSQGTSKAGSISPPPTRSSSSPPPSLLLVRLLGAPTTGGVRPGKLLKCNGSAQLAVYGNLAVRTDPLPAPPPPPSSAVSGPDLGDSRRSGLLIRNTQSHDAQCEL